MKCDKVVLTKEKWLLVVIFNLILICLIYAGFYLCGIDIQKETLGSIGLIKMLPIYLFASCVNSLIFYSRLGEKNEN